MESYPLCSGQSVHHYHSDKKRDYLQYSRCELVFVPRAQRLDAVSEKAHYDLPNDPQDQGYRRFLSRLADPILQRIAPGSKGLDFGCGRGRLCR